MSCDHCVHYCPLVQNSEVLVPWTDSMKGAKNGV